MIERLVHRGGSVEAAVPGSDHFFAAAFAAEIRIDLIHDRVLDVVVLAVLVEDTVCVNAKLPADGFFTVTENVTVADAAPGPKAVASAPVQDSTFPTTVALPLDAATPPAYVASSNTPARSSVNVAAAYGICPVFVTVTV